MNLKTNGALRKLTRLYAAAALRAQRLAAANRRLRRELRQCRRSELALRRSEKNFRDLFDRARAMEGSLRTLSSRLLHAHEEERKRISRELHDQTGQALTAISITLASLNGNSHLNRRKIAEAQQLLRGTMEALHNFAHDMRPTSLDELGLVPALRSYLRAFVARTGLKVSFRATRSAEQLASAPKVVLFRVAQESLTNAARHAGASRVELRIARKRDRIRMTIADNGRARGAGQSEAERLGRLGMEERVRWVNGQLQIQPAPGRGTTVQVAVPLGAAASLQNKKIFDPYGDKPRNGVV